MEEAPLPHRAHDDRPWGGFEQFTLGDPCTVKLLTVKDGQRFSLQTHTKRDEFWRVLSGSGVVTVGDYEHQAGSGQEFWIPRASKHRAQAIGSDLLILEISFGEFDEKDIERIEDDYGRA